jgi:ribose transport system permease protein
MRFLTTNRAITWIASQAARYVLLVVLAGIVVGFTIARPDTFGTSDNFQSILNAQVTTAFVALGATLPFVVGEFDLSVAATATFVQVVFVGMVIEHGWPVGVSALLVLAIALVVGTVNGIAIARYKVSSFIVTLATGSVVSGLMLAYSNGQTIFGVAPHSLTTIARSTFLGIALPFYYVAIVAVVLALVLGSTAVGRRMYATGSNQRAAQLTGIPTARYVLSTFVASSVLASAGGLLLGSKLGSATPDTSNALLIPAFAAAFLGATGFTPGRFNIPGTFVAVYIVGTAVTGLQQVSAALWASPVFNGGVLFVAIGLSAWTRRLRSAAARRQRLHEMQERVRQTSDPSPDTTTDVVTASLPASSL